MNKITVVALLIFLISVPSRQCGGGSENRNGGGRSPDSQQSIMTAASATPTPSPRRELYHGVHPGSADGDETRIDDLAAYESAVGKEAAFVYFSQELDEKWLDGDFTEERPLFPRRKVDAIRGSDAVPFIRLMTRASDAQNEQQNNETIYSFDVLLDEPALTGEKLKRRGQFRERILEWAKEAAKVDSTIYVEWGTEVNGKWFWWNAYWYAEEQCARTLGDRERKNCIASTLPKGVETFREVFRHLRELVNVRGGASNVKWIFHVTAAGGPYPVERGQKNLWNVMAGYYPGAEYVDAIGVSVYGAQTGDEKCDGEEHSFAEQFEQVMTGQYRAKGDSLTEIAVGKKVFVLEIGETLFVGKSEKPISNCNAGKWAGEALDALFDASRWDKFDIAGFAWWNEAWVDKDEGITDMRVHPFDFCAALPEDARRGNKVKGKSCDCWRGGAKGCDNLAGKREALRQALSQKLKAYDSSLRTKADEKL